VGGSTPWEAPPWGTTSVGGTRVVRASRSVERRPYVRVRRGAFHHREFTPSQRIPTGNNVFVALVVRYSGSLAVSADCQPLEQKPFTMM
jgi:hypothetical protein